MSKTLKYMFEAFVKATSLGGRFSMLDNQQVCFSVGPLNELLIYSRVSSNSYVYIRNVQFEGSGVGSDGDIYWAILSDVLDWAKAIGDRLMSEVELTLHCFEDGSVCLLNGCGKSLQLKVMQGEEALINHVATHNMMKLCSTNGNKLALDEVSTYNLACYSRPRITFDEQQSKPVVSFSNVAMINHMLDASMEKIQFSARCNAVLNPEMIARIVEPNCKTYVDLLLGIDSYAIFVKRTNLMFMQLETGWRDAATTGGG